MTANWEPTLPFGSGRIIGAIWVVSVIGGIYGYLINRGTHVGDVALLISGGAYVAVSALLYDVFKPVNSSLSLFAAFCGLMAVIGFAGTGDSSFFGGIQCIVLGYFILISGLLPRTIGVLIAIAGFGQLIFLSTLLPPALAKPIAPAGYITDGIGEGALALWLTIMGVNTVQWKKLARREAAGAAA